jgi:general secretion pathway protein G
MRMRGRGFTMIELMAVMAVLAVLAWIAMPLAELSRQRERERELQQALWQIRDAIDAYKRASDALSPTRDPGVSGYPPTLLALVQGLPDPKAGGRLTYFLRRVPRDPFAPPELPPEQTWGLRAFASPADAPAAGADVYDVYSRAPGAGLNGVPFRSW